MQSLENIGSIIRDGRRTIIPGSAAGFFSASAVRHAQPQHGKERLQADSRQGKLGEALDRIHSRLEGRISILRSCPANWE